MLSMTGKGSGDTSTRHPNEFSSATASEDHIDFVLTSSEDRWISPLRGGAK
jgi:hypothetical protein